MQVRPSREKPRSKTLRGRGQRVVHVQKRPEFQKGPGTYKVALTNINLQGDDQNCILEELGRVLGGTSIGQSHRLEAGVLYICAQQSGQWLARGIDNHTLQPGARLKATDARNLPKPVKVALRMREKVAQTQDELLKWIKNLNPGLHTEH
jgi:hypothetical protein